MKMNMNDDQMMSPSIEFFNTDIIKCIHFFTLVRLPLLVPREDKQM